MAKKRKSSAQPNGVDSLQKAKAHQAAALRELGDALVKAGHFTIKEQAVVLGLSRSTTWTILRGSHKGSGLSAAVVNKI